MFIHSIEIGGPLYFKNIITKKLVILKIFLYKNSIVLIFRSGKNVHKIGIPTTETLMRIKDFLDNAKKEEIFRSSTSSETDLWLSIRHIESGGMSINVFDNNQVVVSGLLWSKFLIEISEKIRSARKYVGKKIE